MGAVLVVALAPDCWGSVFFKMGAVGLLVGQVRGAPFYGFDVGLTNRGGFGFTLLFDSKALFGFFEF